MITLHRAWIEGEDNEIPEVIKLNTGATVFPKDRTVRVLDEDDAAALERLGWERDAASKAAKAEADDLLRKGMNMQLAKMLGAEQTEHVTRNPSAHDACMMPNWVAPSVPRRDLQRHAEIAQFQKRDPHSVGGASYHPRTEFGVVPVEIAESDGFPHRRGVVVSVDTDSINVHGVNTLLTEIDKDLRESAVATAASFNAAITADLQRAAVTTIGLIVSEVLRRDKELSTHVRNQLDRQRYD